MKASNIHDDHQFVKFCKNRELIKENGVVIRVQPYAFELRAPTREFSDPEKTISGVYYEFFDGEPDEKICACYHFIQMTIKPKDALARMGVGLIKEQGSRRSRTLRVRHQPDKDCLAYAELLGLPRDVDDELCALLAAASIVEIVPVTAIV